MRSGERAGPGLLRQGGAASPAGASAGQGAAFGGAGLVGSAAGGLQPPQRQQGPGPLYEPLGRLSGHCLPAGGPEQPVSERRRGGLPGPIAGQCEPAAAGSVLGPGADHRQLPPSVCGRGRAALVAPAPCGGQGRAHPLLRRPAVAGVGPVRICGGHRGCGAV